MRKPDDSSLTPEQYINIRREAERRLRDASAFGVFPTPVDDIIAASKILVSPHNILDENFITQMRYKVTNVLKSVGEKIWGIFDAVSKMIFIDRSVIKVKQTFLKLHEVGHATLQHQSKLFSLFEDCNLSLDPDTSELFDREANVFATEVLFQLGSFDQEASDMQFNIKTPMNLSKRYGASIYSSIRRYVSNHHKNCAVLVFNQPDFRDLENITIGVRRFIGSASFLEKFGDCFPDSFNYKDDITRLIPLHRGMSKPFELLLTDRNGEKHECVAEGFNSSHQIFLLIHAKKTLSKSTSLIMPNAFQSSDYLASVGT